MLLWFYSDSTSATSHVSKGYSKTMYNMKTTDVAQQPRVVVNSSFNHARVDHYERAGWMLTSPKLS